MRLFSNLYKMAEKKIVDERKRVTKRIACEHALSSCQSSFLTCPVSRIFHLFLISSIFFYHCPQGLFTGYQERNGEAHCLLRTLSCTVQDEKLALNIFLLEDRVI